MSLTRVHLSSGGCWSRRLNREEVVRYIGARILLEERLSPYSSLYEVSDFGFTWKATQGRRQCFVDVASGDFWRFQADGG